MRKLGDEGDRPGWVWAEAGRGQGVEGPGQGKDGPEITGTREVWTRDRWDRGSIDQDRRPRVQVKRLDLGAGWWTKRFKGTRGNQVTSGPAKTFC
ncbi:hypothetical protein B9Z19DRAFT_1133149 [Tuber borchii]|uniref:Uncharacterized protein n=1 Tax=Tuber borchii TaxID=42251 RepID=A0A2T6ZGF0_TUBBO|nr:hypothetical protein B9Z19DRAFT_1133149 [Tuber borchii]